MLEHSLVCKPIISAFGSLWPENNLGNLKMEDEKEEEKEEENGGRDGRL